MLQYISNYMLEVKLNMENIEIIKFDESCYGSEGDMDIFATSG